MLLFQETEIKHFSLGAQGVYLIQQLDSNTVCSEQKFNKYGQL